MSFLEALFARVQRHPWRWLIAALLTVTAIAQLGPYATITQEYGESSLFDMHPTFDPQVATQRLQHLGAEGRLLYQQGLAVDILFSLGNGLLLLVLLRPLNKAPARLRKAAVTCVLLAVGLDLLENALITVALISETGSSWIVAAAAVTFAKLLTFGFAFLAAIALWAALLVAHIRRGFASPA